MLLDEPLSALDANVRAYLRDQIRALQRRFGATTLLVTHDQEEALAMADRVAVLKDGRLLQIAAPHVLYERPACRAVAEFVGLSTLLPGRVAAPDRVDVGFARLATATARARRAGRCMCWCVPSMSRPIRRLARPIVWRAGSAPCVIWAPSRATTSRCPGRPRPFAQGSLPVAGAIAIDPARICLLDD